MSCPNCQEGIVLPGEPTGTLESDFEGAYFAPAPSSATSEGVSATAAARAPSRRAILLLTDAFGLPLKNSKILADELAKKVDCDVWVPDIFAGKPVMPLDIMRLPERAGEKLSIWQWIKFAITVVIPNIPRFIASRPAKLDPRLEQFIRLVKEKRKYEKIGAVGYCFGGTVAIRFGRRADLVDSVLIAHPGPFSVEDVSKIVVPNAWACAEDDHYLSPELREKTEAQLASRKGKDNYVDYEVKWYKGTAHGFAARPNLSIPEIKEAYEAALDQTVEWFKRTL